MTRWLRNKVDGTIYEWDRYLAGNPKCEEVSEEEAFPDRFPTRPIQFAEPLPTSEEVAASMAGLEVEIEEEVKPARRGRKRKDDIPAEPAYTNEDLNEEVTRRLG
jgi:hypothetical protein